jgi:hypothetical protein
MGLMIVLFGITYDKKFYGKDVDINVTKKGNDEN